MFTKNRKLHQDATTAEITGQVPTAMFLHANPGDESMNHRNQSFGWSGCLDAPELIPVGGVRAVYISPEIGGMGFEGMAAKNRHREAE